jgi:hypothetical protein
VSWDRLGCGCCGCGCGLFGQDWKIRIRGSGVIVFAVLGECRVVSYCVLVREGVRGNESVYEGVELACF